MRKTFGMALKFRKRETRLGRIMTATANETKIPSRKNFKGKTNDGPQYILRMITDQRETNIIELNYHQILFGVKMYTRSECPNR